VKTYQQSVGYEPQARTSDWEGAPSPHQRPGNGPPFPTLRFLGALCDAQSILPGICATVARACDQYLVDAIGYYKIQGVPMSKSELVEAIREQLTVNA
jgi:hypothetical protein